MISQILFLRKRDARPQTIWRINRGIKIIADGSQRMRIIRGIAAA